jgi:gliding motility-associated-like protein
MRNLIVILFWLLSFSAKAQSDTVYYNSTSVYYVIASPGITYTWSVAYPGSIVSGQGTNSITVNWGFSNIGSMPNAVSVFATNSFGCVSAMANLNIVFLIPESKIFFPNAFTPDGDGRNDGWSPITTNIVEIRWMIYNRWGEKVYESNRIGDKWNGVYKGAQQGIFNFVWICWWRGIDGKKGFDKGNLILIR